METLEMPTTHLVSQNHINLYFSLNFKYGAEYPTYSLLMLADKIRTPQSCRGPILLKLSKILITVKGMFHCEK